MLNVLWFIKRILYLPRIPILWLVRLYQHTLSPDHGLLKYRFPRGYCRLYPSCSEYAYLAIKKYGLLAGVSKAVWRVLRCNPWGKGGVDMP